MPSRFLANSGSAARCNLMKFAQMAAQLYAFVEFKQIVLLKAMSQSTICVFSFKFSLIFV